MTHEQAIPYFLSRIRFTRGCWEWTRPVPHQGYAQIRLELEGRHTVAHRFSYTLFVGSITPGALVCHRCDWGKCVRPAHLFQSDPAGNARDRALKGRSRGNTIFPPLPEQTPVILVPEEIERERHQIDIASATWGFDLTAFGTTIAPEAAS